MKTKLYVEILAEPRLGIQTWHRIEVPGIGTFENDVQLAKQYEAFFHSKGVVARIMHVQETIAYIGKD